MQEPVSISVVGHGGLRLNVWDYGGEGPTLLFCHCTGGVARLWDAVLTHMRMQCRILALDMRGHGDSDNPATREDCAWEHAGKDVLAVLDALSPREPIYAVGHSAGGAQLAYAALYAPGTFHGMALLDPIIAPKQELIHGKRLAAGARRRKTHFADRPTAKVRFSHRAPMSTWCEEALDAYVQFGLCESPEGGVTLSCPSPVEAWNYEIGGGCDAFRQLHTITCPVLLVTGRDSGFASLASMQVTQLPQARLEIMEGVGHFIPQERPVETAVLLDAWLSCPGFTE